MKRLNTEIERLIMSLHFYETRLLVVYRYMRRRKLTLITVVYITLINQQISYTKTVLVAVVLARVLNNKDQCIIIITIKHMR